MPEGPYKLPKGWRWVRFGEVCEVVMGQSPPSKTYNRDGEGLPFFQGKADFGELYPSPHVWCTKPTKIAEVGDILISVRAPVGPTNVANTRCCIGRGLAALRPGDVLDRWWLLYYLRSIEDILKKFGTGSTFKSITKRELIVLPIPLPPLSKQRQIIAYLNEMQAKITALRKHQEETTTEFYRLEQTILREL